MSPVHERHLFVCAYMLTYQNTLFSDIANETMNENTTYESNCGSIIPWITCTVCSLMWICQDLYYKVIL